MSLYDYAGGDPINFVDPTGRSAGSGDRSGVTQTVQLFSDSKLASTTKWGVGDSGGGYYGFGGVDSFALSDLANGVRDATTDRDRASALLRFADFESKAELRLARSLDISNDLTVDPFFIGDLKARNDPGLRAVDAILAERAYDPDMSRWVRQQAYSKWQGGENPLAAIPPAAGEAIKYIASQAVLMVLTDGASRLAGLLRSGNAARTVGSGPARGFIEVSESYSSVNAVKNFQGKGTDFIFDTQTKRFVMGNNPAGHTGIADLMGVAESQQGRLVGGTIYRENGVLMTNEHSGHFGNLWNAANRTQFQQFMKNSGISSIHSASW